MVEIKKDHINGIRMAKGHTKFVEPVDYTCLYDNCQGYKDYIEIGTKWGASAIIAGHAVTGEVHCIDPFGVKGFPDRKAGNFFVYPEYVRENWALHHDPSRLVIHKQKHPPWPKELGDRMFDVGLIDGCHDADCVWADWQAMRERVRYRILFHDVNYRGEDYDPESTAEKNAAQVFNRIIVTDKEWRFLEIRGKMGVLERI